MGKFPDSSAFWDKSPTLTHINTVLSYLKSYGIISDPGVLT